MQQLAELVPPKRLGQAMSDYRKERNIGLRALAHRSNGWFSVRDLKRFESGKMPVDQETLLELTALYEIEALEVLVARKDLEISLEYGVLEVGGRKGQWEPTQANVDEILKRYLGLLYSVREVRVGAQIPLRDRDLTILAQALELPADSVRAQLLELIATQQTQIKILSRAFDRKVLVPAAGILVAATAVGSLVMIPRLTRDKSVSAINPANVPVVDVQSPPESATGGTATQVGDTKVSSTRVERSDSDPGSGEPGAVAPLPIPYDQTGPGAPADPSGVQVDPDDGTPGGIQVEK